MPRIDPRAAAGAIGLIITAIIAHEGGYVNNPSDPGGETNWGITAAVARENGYTGPMRAMPRETAEAIYKRVYIDRPGFMPIIELEPTLAEEVVDTGVLTGPARVTLWFHESLNLFNNRGRDYAGVSESGPVSAADVAAFKALQARRGKVLACQLMVKALDAKQAAYFMRIAGRDGPLETFEVGWFDKRIGNVKLDRCQP